MPKAKQLSIPPPSPEEIAAMRHKDRQDYLAQARHLIDDLGWNLYCRSRRCRRNGCQDVSRCEPRERARVHRVLTRLMLARLEENSLSKEVREGPAAAERRALLANARRRGWLPSEETW